MYSFTLNKFYHLNAYSWSESRKTLLVYSSSKDVFDKSKASRLGRLNANAVPIEDCGLAPISKYSNVLLCWKYSFKSYYFAKGAILLFSSKPVPRFLFPMFE